MKNDQFKLAFPSNYNSIRQFLLTIFLMAAFEWFAAVDMSSSDSIIKKSTLLPDVISRRYGTVVFLFSLISTFPAELLLQKQVLITFCPP